MKALKSILAVTAICAAAIAVNAVESLQSPRAQAVKHPSISATVDADQVQSATTVGGAARSKAIHAVVESTGVQDPNLIGCAKVGKATCSGKPCCTNAKVTACKK